MHPTLVTRPRGLTLLELLVVTAIVAVLLALLASAVQMARERASRLQCANNLRQLGLALQSYHDARGGFPPAVWTRPRRQKVMVSWVPFILPYIGEENLSKEYNFKAPFTDPSNDDGLNQTKLKLLLCPASPSSGASAQGRGMTDYAPTCDVNRRIKNPFLDPVPKRDRTFMGVLGRNVARKISEIPDGTSNTLLLAEDAGRSEHWQMGSLVEPTPTEKPAWANPRHRLSISGFDTTAAGKPGPCAVNCSNDGEVYSFHRGGANVLFADGSARLLSAGIDINVMAALITRNQGEVVPSGID